MKRKIKSLFSLLAVVAVLLSSMMIPALAVTPSDAKKSVVVVISQDGYSYGSGFAIGEVGKPIEYIVTNNHVVHPTNFSGNTTATVAFSLASGNYMVSNIYYYNAEKDIAILKLPEMTTEREAMALRPMEYVDPDDEYAALGYPSNQATDWPKYNMDDITITKGGIKKSDRVNGLDVYMLDLTLTHGSSGGPLVSSTGEVVGINTFRVGTENYALAIDELLAVIDTDRIAVTVYPVGPPISLIVAVAVLILIVVLVVVLLLLRKRKKPAPAPAPGPAPGPGPAPVPAAKSAHVIAVGGPLNGRKFALNGTVKVGRDSNQCGIAFPVNTKGVGRLHCEVTFDGSSCFVRDLSSQYGTFTMDGQQLAPNTPHILQSGEKFYLASPINCFEVRF